MVDGAEFAASEVVGGTYALVRNVLGMKWSDECRLFVTDVKK